jgi:hypothetical protein
LTTLVKHLPGKHDQRDHGLWAAGMDPKDVPFARKREEIASAVVLDLDALRTNPAQRARTMDDGEFAREFMRAEYDRYRTREMDRLRAKWESMNPGEEWSLGKVEDQLPQLAIEVMTDDGLIQARRDEMASVDPQENLKAAFTHTLTLKDGRTVNVVPQSISGFRGTWQVEGYHELGGVQVGRWSRTVYAATPNDEYVYNSSQTIAEQYQNLGIAGRFNGAMESVYIASGIKKVTVTAADLRNGRSKDALAGAFVWAMQGFDWSRTGVGSSTGPRRAVDKYMNTAEFRNLPEPIRRSIESTRQRFGLSTSDPDYPTPREVATLGMLPGETWWPGKAIMNHNGRSFAEHRRSTTTGGAPGWNGEKILSDPAGLRVSSGEVISYEARQAVQSDPELMAAVQQAFAQQRRTSTRTAADRSEAARRAWETRRRNAAAREIEEQQRQAALAGAA